MNEVNQMSLPVIISSVGLVVSVLGYFHNRFVYQVALEHRLATVEAHTAPFVKALEQMAVTILHHPTQYARDELLEKFQDNKLSMTEAVKLKEMLEVVLEDEKAPALEQTAAMLLAASIVARYGVE